MCLPWGVGFWLWPSWQMSTIQDPRKKWLATGNLFTVWWRMLVSGAKIGAAPCLPTLAVACLPLCLWWRRCGGMGGWERPVHSMLALLWHLLNPLFCEQFRLQVKSHLWWNRSPAQAGCTRQVLRPGALGRPRGIGWRGRWEGGSGWGIHVNPRLIHVSVWQKPLQ